MISTGSDLQRALDAIAADLLPTAALLDAAAGDAAVDPRVVGALADAGFTGCAVSDAHGGLGFAVAEVVDLCEVAGRRLIATALREEALLLAPLVEELVRRGHAHGMLLQAILAGHGHGGGAAVLDERSASLVRCDGGYALSLDDVPAWLPPGAGLIALRLPVAVVLLELDSVPVRIERRRSLEPAQGFCLLSCRDVFIAADRVVDGDAGAALVHRHRVALLAECVGVAGEVVRRAVDYAAGREQFGRPIARFQAVAHLLSDAAAALETSRSGLARLLAITPPSWCPGDAATMLATALAHGIPAATRVVCENAIQVHGGLGFTWESGLHLYYRRALQLQVVLGGASGSAAAVGARYLDERRRLHE